VGGLTDNRGYIAGGTLDYRYSEQTGFRGTAMFSHYSSDLTRSDAITTTLGVVHQVSPQLTLSAAVAGYWSDIEAKQTALACPAAPFLCSVGLVPQVVIASGADRRDSGPLYGGGISYAISEASQLSATVTQSLVPGSTGSIARSSEATASFSHGFSDRLTGRVGFGYGRTRYPTALSGWFANDYYLGEVGASYRLAEHWTLEAGYRYARAEYADDPSRPASNVAFITIAYNWAAGSFTDWVGTRVGVDPRLGAGPIPLPERRPPPARGQSPGGPRESLPFGTFTIP
jgi:long-subunit fatty acid transport protein